MQNVCLVVIGLQIVAAEACLTEEELERVGAATSPWTSATGTCSEPE